MSPSVMRIKFTLELGLGIDVFIAGLQFAPPSCSAPGTLWTNSQKRRRRRRRRRRREDAR
jgi:hypothetical protein